MDLTQEIKKLVIDEGFHKVGIAPVKHLRESLFLIKWLNSGRHGKMSWLERNKEFRINVKKYFPDAKSVISVAHNYFTDIKYGGNKHSINISRYAMGGDYHKIIKSKLKNILINIKKLDSGLNGRICVDSSPVQEKLWAVEAGIGWQGKHSIIITEEYGSWIFLGELIVNRTLDYDHPVKDLCGNCTKCMDACPTNAIVTPYSIDSVRCISYHTIETRSNKIPEEVVKKMNGWVYGCDICQQVCPWNIKYQHSTGEKFYITKTDLSDLKVSRLGEITENEFNDLFKDSPIYRTGYKTFMRNVHAVLNYNSTNIAGTRKNKLYKK